MLIIIQVMTEIPEVVLLIQKKITSQILVGIMNQVIIQLFI